MAEVKTPPVTARHIPDKDDFREPNHHGGKTPGSFRVDGPDEDGECGFWYCCPCGCGRFARLIVGNGFKPACGPSWNWNGSFDKPTLKPSVHHRGHWHGYLTDGVWKSC